MSSNVNNDAPSFKMVLFFGFLGALFGYLPFGMYNLLPYIDARWREIYMWIQIVFFAIVAIFCILAFLSLLIAYCNSKISKSKGEEENTNPKN